VLPVWGGPQAAAAEALAAVAGVVFSIRDSRQAWQWGSGRVELRCF